MKKLIFFILLLIGLVSVNCDSDTSTQTASTQTASTQTASTQTASTQTTSLQTTSQSSSNTTDAKEKTFKYQENNKTCLIVTLKAYFNQSGTIFNVSNDAHEVKSMSGCGKMAVIFGESNTFILTFRNNSKMYWLQQVDAFIDSDNGTASGLDVGNSTLKASYKCDAGFTAKLSDNTTMVATNVQFQAFVVSENKYGTAQICTNDIGNNVIIPIAVGCALIGLIIIVLIAYMIGRKRVKHRYEAM